MQLTPSELKVDLGISKMQAKRIKRALDAGAASEEQHAAGSTDGPLPTVDTTAADEVAIYAAIQVRSPGLLGRAAPVAGGARCSSSAASRERVAPHEA